MENWKTCPSAPKYAVSDGGNIKRIVPPKRNRDYGGPTPRQTHHGYLYVALRVGGRRKNFMMHRLIMEAFVGPSDLQVNHKNGIKQDNRLENLEYVTPKENQRHSRDVIKTMPLGNQHHNSKLTEQDVEEIHLLAKSGVPKAQIGRMYGVSGANICIIVSGKGWRHVKAPPPQA